MRCCGMQQQIAQWKLHNAQIYETVEQCTKAIRQNFDGKHECLWSWLKIYVGLKTNDYYTGLRGDT